MHSLADFYITKRMFDDIIRKVAMLIAHNRERASKSVLSGVVIWTTAASANCEQCCGRSLRVIEPSKAQACENELALLDDYSYIQTTKR